LLFTKSKRQKSKRIAEKTTSGDLKQSPQTLKREHKCTHCAYPTKPLPMVPMVTLPTSNKNK
jgi:hypothetical protein